MLTISNSVFFWDPILVLWFLKITHIHRNTCAAKRDTQYFWMPVHWGALLLTSRSANLDPTLLAFTEFIKSTAGSFKSSSTFRNEQHRFYFINTQFLCWLTLQKSSGWKTNPSDILIFFFLFLIAYYLENLPDSSLPAFPYWTYHSLVLSQWQKISHGI